MSDTDTILIAEDNFNFRRLITKRLDEEEVKVLMAGTKEEAVDQIEEAGEIDLFLIDVMLPDCPGYELFEEIKERGLDEKPVLVASSVQEEVFNPPEQARVNYDKYIDKPAPVGDIMDEIQACLSQKN